MAQLLLLKKRPRRRAEEPVMAWPLRLHLPRTDVQALLDSISDVLAKREESRD